MRELDPNVHEILKKHICKEASSCEDVVVSTRVVGGVDTLMKTYFLRKLKFFHVSNKMLLVFSQFVKASASFCVCVCCGSESEAETPRS